MKSNRVAAAIGMVDDDLIVEAVDAKAVKHKPIWLRMGIAAVCAASVLGAFVVGAYAYCTPSSYVSLDVNPSIEYALNTFGRVLSVQGVNDDGENILEDIGLTRLQNKAIDKAIRETINAIAKLGYFPEDSEGGVVIAVSDKKAEKAEKLSEKLKETVEQATQEEQLDVEVESMAVGKERVDEAKSLGVTPGKLNLVEKLKESAEDPDDVDIEAWLNKPVKDIMKQTKANKALSKGKESDTDDTADDGSDEESDVIGHSDKGNSANKPDKTNGKDKSSNETNNSNNGNSANKSDNAAKKDNSSNASNSSNGNNGSNQSDNASNKGQSKKLYAAIDAQNDDSSETSDATSDEDISEASEEDSDEDISEASEEDLDKGNSSEKSNSSNKSNSSEKSNSSGKSKNSKK